MSNIIKIGTQDVTLKVGSSPVTAAYLGSTQVYPEEQPVTDFKYKLTLSDSSVISAACDGTSAITRSEISAYSESCVSAEINDCVTNIDASAFLGFTNIRNVSLLNSLTTIGDYAFYHCVKLTGLTIPSGVTTIGQQVLAYTENISSITVEATTPATIGQNAFGSQNFPIYVPCESLTLYQQEWDEYASRITCIQPTGHTYVDLGLPSGTKWATMNVGASSETDYGDYYQYGKGASTYQTTSGESDYRSSLDPLPATADTAVQVWGDNWHIPTKTQFEELTANTTFEFTTIDGIAGAKYTAQNGNYIFLPASGVYYNGTLSVLGTYGEYLSSTPNGSQEFYFLMFDSGGKTIYNNHRYLGMPVRPVMDN